MDATFKLVLCLPLEQLWRGEHALANLRGRQLKAEDIRELLRSRPVQFVIADVGLPLRWIDVSERFEFWKKELKSHIANRAPVVLEEYPDGYFYFASEWTAAESMPIVLLEKHH